MPDDEPGREWQDGKTRARCHGSKADGSRCSLEEVPDLGYCFAHVPDELVPQAEQITGRKRCRARASANGPDGKPTAHTGHRCGSYAIPGGEVCGKHGGKLPTVKRAAFEQILSGEAEKQLAVVMNVEAKTGMVMRAGEYQPITNPFEELMRLAGEVKAFKDRIGARVAAMRVEEFRYEHERAGEQIRAEIGVYQRAMEQLSTVLLRIAKLNIEERMMRITERQAEIIEQALMRTLADPEFDLPAAVQMKMKAKVVERLRVA